MAKGGLCAPEVGHGKEVVNMWLQLLLAGLRAKLQGLDSVANGLGDVTLRQ